MTRTALSLFLGAVVAIALAGCAGSQVREQANTTLDHQNAIAKDYLHQATNRAGGYEGPIVTKVPWVSVHAVPTPTPLPPAIFDRHAALNEPYPTQVQSVLNKLRDLTGLDVRLERDVIERPALQKVLTNAGSTPTGTTDSSGLSSVFSQQSLTLGAAEVTGASLPKVTISVSHIGTVKQILDSVASALQCQWRYEPDNHRILFYRYVTAYYHVVGFPGTTTNNNTVSSGSGGSGSTGSSATVTYSGSQLSPWKDLTTGIKALLSADGRYIVDQNSGTVVVRDLPAVVHRVTKFVHRLNNESHQQLAVDVRVYRVEVNGQDTRGINWAMLFNSSGYTASLVTPRGDLTNLSTLMVGVPSTSTARLAGSQGFFDSLSQLGKVSVVSTTTLRTVNHQMVPFNSTSTVRYISSTQVESTANVGTTTTQQTGSVEVGFSLQILPDIQPNGRNVLMQIGMNLSSLDSMQSVTQSGSTVQLPQTSKRDFEQRIWMRSGQSLVIAGYQQVNTSLTKSGLITYNSWAAGGRADASDGTDTLVIVITPHLRRIGDDFSAAS